MALGGQRPAPGAPSAADGRTVSEGGCLLAARDPRAEWILDRWGSQTSTAVHLGVGVARRRGGQVIPVLLDADRRDLDDLMHALLAIVRRARAGRLQQSDLGHPTFTVTSLGELGVQTVFPAIVPPQVGGVGFGKVVEQPSAVAGTIVCSPVVTATLAADQRVVDGHRGARFLTAIERRLQEPETL